MMLDSGRSTASTGPTAQMEGHPAPSIGTYAVQFKSSNGVAIHGNSGLLVEDVEFATDVNQQKKKIK